MSRHPTAPPADDRQSGQVVVLTLVVLAVLLGMSATVLDAGSWYRADRALQSTVDASALAEGQALPEDPPLASSLALEYAEKNGGGVESVSIETELNADDTILVTGSRPAPAFFTKLFGIDEVQVEARAKEAPRILHERRLGGHRQRDRRGPGLRRARALAGRVARFRFDRAAGTGRVSAARNGENSPPPFQWSRLARDSRLNG